VDEIFRRIVLSCYADLVLVIFPFKANETTFNVVVFNDKNRHNHLGVVLLCYDIGSELLLSSIC
jgi:hypothetical protein